MTNQSLWNFFVTNNKSGHKSRKTFLKNNHPELLDDIETFSNINDLYNLNFKAQIWHYITNTSYIPTCKECKKTLKFQRSISENYKNFCSIACANKNNERKENIKNTNIKKYGKPSPAQNKTILNKMKDTNKKRYGVENIMERQDFVDKIKSTLKNKYNVENPYQIQEVKDNISNKISERYTGVLDYNNGFKTYHCEKCNNTTQIHNNRFNYRVKNNLNPCIICNKPFEYNKQNEIIEFLKSYSITVERNNRTLLDGKEIDIYLPDYKIGIEFNGLYWHCNLFKDKNYHKQKLELANSKNISLIQIFEDEWIYKKEIVKSLILSKIDKLPNKIYGRNCFVKKINSKLGNKFINNNHLQGPINSSVYLGLFYNNDLIAVMSFKYQKNEIHMARFCNKKYYKIIGGANKLFKYFLRNYNYNKIVSYCNLRFSDGNLYNKLGFQFNKITKPNYFYIIKDKRLHRYNFNKQKLVNKGYNKNKTEFQIMEDLGYNRIYDCGHQKFVFQLN